MAYGFDKAAAFFDEIKSATAKNRELWGIDIYGPVLLVVPETRAVIANVAASSESLKQKGQIFTGRLPEDIGIANTCVNWEGKNWAMIILPLPEKKSERINLLTHELFHCSQARLGFTAHNPSNTHLDEKEGRIFLRMELEALKKAIASNALPERKGHLTSAFTFRKYRQSMFENAKKEENFLELNEGLAEYTGVIMSARSNSEMQEHLTSRISDITSNPSFVRSFAYETTPAYGYLLSGINKNWQTDISRNENLTEYFQKAFQIQPITLENNLLVEQTNRYNGAVIYEEENLRDEKIKRLKREYTNKFVKGSHLKISLENMKISFDPRNLIPLGQYGIVYPNLRITDTWGILTVENGALLSASWDKVSITKPTKVTSKQALGDGWTLEITDGYFIKQDRENNYILLPQ